MTALILGACGGPLGVGQPLDVGQPLGDGQPPGTIEEGMLLGEDSVEVFGDLSLESEIGIRQNMAYVAVRNDGPTGDLFAVGLVLFDAEDTILDEHNVYCGSIDGGATIATGSVAHCLFQYLDDGLPTPVRAEIGFVGMDDALYPRGLWEVRGDVQVSGAGSSMGSAEAEVCRRQGVSDVHEDVYLQAYALDTSGVPYGHSRENHTIGSATCMDMSVGGLELPDDPEVLLIP